MWIDDEQQPIKTGTTNPLVTVKHVRLNMYESIALVKNNKSNKHFYRHRYNLSTGNNLAPFPTFKDYKREEFNSIKEFQEFIESKPKEDKQILPTGTYNKPK